MRLAGKIFLLLLLISVPVAAGAEMLTGTVIAVNREQNSFILDPAGEGTLRVKKINSPLPARMKPGRQIRIWGSYDPTGTLFRATDIRGAGKRRHHDQTGVRARIGNGRYCRKDHAGAWKPPRALQPKELPAAQNDSVKP